MKGLYRSRSRLVMDLLAAIKTDGPVGVTRLLAIANLTHAKIQDLLATFQQCGWIQVERTGDKTHWRLTEAGEQVLADLRRVDAVMQDHGLGL